MAGFDGILKSVQWQQSILSQKRLPHGMFLHTLLKCYYIRPVSVDVASPDGLTLRFVSHEPEAK